MECEIQDWNYPEIPTLRLNEFNIIEVRRHFNSVIMALVCICNDYGMTLLESLAKDLNRMRQARIILWMDKKLTHNLLNVIAAQVEKHEFYQMIILEATQHPMDTIPIRRLDIFPSIKFEKIDDILDLKGPIFYTPEENFKGKVFNLLPDWEATMCINVTLSPGVSIPIVRNSDYGIIQFAFIYNLSFRVLNASYKLPVDGTSLVPDIQLKTQVHTNMENLKNWNPHDISSLMVAVPCGKELSIEEVFKQLDVNSWLRHIFFVYIIFVVAEAFILVITHRISGRSCRFSHLIPVLNLRAFRAILGMSFPISRRSSLSLRQLFLAINIFGLISSSFFNCKLKAVLMKHSDQPHVKNFEDLRDSGLDVIAGPAMDAFLNSETGADFVRNKLINLKSVSQWEQIEMLLNANTYNAYLMFSENWEVLNKFHKYYGRSLLCRSKNLTIIEALPMTYILKNNSMLDRSLFRFMMRLHEHGFVGHWLKQSPYILGKAVNTTIQRNYVEREKALSLHHFEWLWCILVCGYGSAIIVFIIEIVFGGQRKTRHSDISHV
ncbi:uncharacterized protein LOC120454214 [Drosophila santomea]|uniref:uncharacterized protein LOC120454214 n=1 Tax=Drosophila santomea TaxID=129105 RepID=UPI0019543500|nr:uncharacterized protein LOC120454214 [Drosophila santomea]